MKANDPAAKALFWFCAVAALSCGGYTPPEAYPVVVEAPSQSWFAPLYGEGRGRVRVRTRVTLLRLDDETTVTRTHHGFRTVVEGLEPFAPYRVEVESAAAPVEFTTDNRGRASVPFGPGLAPPGTRIRIADPAGVPVLVGTVPPWNRRPGAGESRRAEYATEDGESTVRVEASIRPGRGRERLEFRFAGFEPGTPLLLRIGGADAATVAAGERGRALARWGPAGGAPLPGAAYAVDDLSGAPFEVLAGGAVVVEGAVP